MFNLAKQKGNLKKKMKKMQIKKAEQENLTEIAALENEIFKEEKYSVNFLEKLLNDNILVAESYNKVVGYVLCTTVFNTAEILKIAVHNTYRNLNIATNLLKELIAEVKNKNVNEIFL